MIVALQLNVQCSTIKLLHIVACKLKFSQFRNLHEFNAAIIN